MDSSSIVSFNNESTLQNTLKPEYSNVSVHELALHAMRDRCLLLQRRINNLEADNMRLKLDITKTKECTPYLPLQEDEKYKLHQKIAELTKQKSQLMQHVFMVSCENKNLWNKISTIKKIDKPKDHSKALIRTNTYIQSTPKTSANYQEKFSESSLEEISLKLLNSYINEKSQLVEQYEQMTQLQDPEGDLNVDSIGFAYIEEPSSDSLKEIKNEIEEMVELKKILSQQEQDLQIVYSRVEKIINEGFKCPSCAQNSTKAITSENKEIETSDSLANWATPTESTNFNSNYSEVKTDIKSNLIESNQEPVNDSTDRICPMCGETFVRDTSFNEFQSHVENHFVGDAEPESVIDLRHVNSVNNIV